MVRRFRGRVVAGRRRGAPYRLPSGKWASKPRKFRYVRSNKGFIKLYRKLPEIYATTTSTNPSLQVQDPTGTCLALGAPIADANGLTASYPFVLTFQLNQIINHNDVTNLCDAYKLKYCSVGMTFQSTQASASSQFIMPTCTWIQDHDDNSVPTSVSQVREKMGCKMKTFGFNKLLKIGVQPRVADTIYNGVLSAYAIAKPMWINSTYDAVPHYAIKGILNNVPVPIGAAVPTSSFKFDITALIYGKDFQ